MPVYSIHAGRPAPADSRARVLLTVAALALLPLAPLRSAGAQTATAADTTDTAPRLRWGGFVDTYVAFDANRPPERDRQFTTQPARHAEFNVNLAHVHVTLEGGRLRGRLALQAGTSVQSNYAGEPTQGAVSGPAVSRFLQEAWVGTHLTPSLAVDAGVFYSNMGMESWESDANPTYTRSLVADYSPYYSSGVRLQWKASDRVTARVDLINGWQNISETNSDKAVGTRLDLTTERFGASWYTFAGKERDAGTRLFTGVGGTAALGDRVRLLAQFDVGRERRAEADGRAGWHGGMFIARVALTDATALVGRVERYSDPEQVILVTGRTEGFRGNGASIGLDQRLAGGVLWRSEVRAQRTRDAVFTSNGGPRARGVVAVTSLSLRF
ncbi:MAG TPA: outer membrane beta-barrel protein [Gemmatimonadaceae bacterium]|nr:outer membrane beta-barrel protein [Gemmatimonadaceae bacterium]